MSTILDIYRDHVAKLRDLRKTIPATSAADLKEVDEEIARIDLHIHRLETDHADCVEPCCLGCKLGGLPPEERGEVGVEVAISEIKP